MLLRKSFVDKTGDVDLNAGIASSIASDFLLLPLDSVNMTPQQAVLPYSKCSSEFQHHHRPGIKSYFVQKYSIRAST